MLEHLTGQTPVTSKTRYTVRAFGIRRNEKIAVHVAIRRYRAEEILERGLKVKEYGEEEFLGDGQLWVRGATSIWARGTIWVSVSSGWTSTLSWAVSVYEWQGGSGRRALGSSTG
ncbi:hypothetical protein FIBSPDRAFT_951212 [Athelia psychrophila]|uniref:Uncharacterized protein n=1 Tax=Athelia psychrophila TaxID=1759441 RepID=A0A166MYK4_9AGAM|nr:hypothetical protein FIBSPDRAFT_951212 [Fibularhizoctonia sp. CBS 109695]